MERPKKNDHATFCGLSECSDDVDREEARLFVVANKDA